MFNLKTILNPRFFHNLSPLDTPLPWQSVSVIYMFSIQRGEMWGGMFFYFLIKKDMSLFGYVDVGWIYGYITPKQFNLFTLPWKGGGTAAAVGE